MDIINFYFTFPNILRLFTFKHKTIYFFDNKFARYIYTYPYKSSFFYTFLTLLRLEKAGRGDGRFL